MSAINDEPGAPLSTPARAGVAVLLVAWFAIAAYGGWTGLFTAGPDSLFRPILLTVAVPVLAFLALYWGSARFRAFILSRNPHTVARVQMWRVLGFAFLPLYAYGVLPGLFAWPAGLGDVAIGLGTPLVLAALARDPGFAASRRFVVWNLLGLLDFVAAASTAMLSSGAIPALISDGVTSAAMEDWPLNMFPAFGVPLFVFAHLTALFQARALRRRAGVAAPWQDSLSRPTALRAGSGA
jgi:hypothetical protein